MIKYKWMGHDAKVRLQRINGKAWMIMLEQTNQDYCMGMVEFNAGRDRYVAHAKGQEFVAIRRIDAIVRLMDFMHSEAMAAKIAAQSIAVDNILGK
jgi:hypothetical protein